MSRRALLAPSARIVVGAAAAAGAVTGFAVVSQVVARPADPDALVGVAAGAALLGVAVAAAAALLGVAVALSATVAQRLAGWSRAVDPISYLALVLGLAGLVADRTSGPPGTGLPATATTIGTPPEGSPWPCSSSASSPTGGWSARTQRRSSAAAGARRRCSPGCPC